MDLPLDISSKDRPSSVPHPPAAEQKMDQDRESKVECGSEKLGLNLTWYLIESAQAQVPSPPKRKMAGHRICVMIKVVE